VEIQSGEIEAAPGVSAITNLTVTRESTPGGVKITAKGERADGSKIDTVTDAKYDGKPVSVTGEGLPCDIAALKQVNDNTITEERSKHFPLGIVRHVSPPDSGSAIVG
jgi:hypothetical protein